MSTLSRSPLFEKLTDENPELFFEKIPKKLLSFKELRESIREDVSRLLNTRLPIFWKDYQNKSRCKPFVYGVSITASTFTEDIVEIRKVEAHIENVLGMFEPRLIDPRVKVKKLDNIPEALFAYIDAAVKIEDRRLPISFPITVNGV